MRLAAFAVMALALAGCHRGTAEVTLDTDADARNATEAKINADLAAADAAARAPVPRAVVRRPVPSQSEPAASQETGNDRQ